MGIDGLAAVVQRLNVSVEALAALTAVMRIEGEGLDADAGVRAALDRVLEAAGVDPAAVAECPSEQLAVLSGTVRGFFGQALELVDAPARPPGWVHDDPDVLQDVGRSSMMLAPLIAQVAPTLGDLDARLRSGTGSVLDIGTGVGLLAVALCRVFPGLRVVGIDVWQPSLALAHANVRSAGLSDRIELRLESATDLSARAEFDAVWFPAPFIAHDHVDAVLERTLTALQPDGWVIAGAFASPPEPLSEAVTDLRTLRSGGVPWTDDDLCGVIAARGFEQVHAVERTWQAPIKFVVGRAPPTK